MAGSGLTYLEMTEEDLRTVARHVFHRSQQIEQQIAALNKELDRLAAQADELIAERQRRGIPSLLDR